MRSYTLFQEYIWLVSIIHKARGITFGEINRQKPRFIILMLPPHALLSLTGAISYVFAPLCSPFKLLRVNLSFMVNPYR